MILLKHWVMTIIKTILDTTKLSWMSKMRNTRSKITKINGTKISCSCHCFCLRLFFFNCFISIFLFFYSNLQGLILFVLCGYLIFTHSFTRNVSVHSRCTCCRKSAYSVTHYFACMSLVSNLYVRSIRWKTKSAVVVILFTLTLTCVYVIGLFSSIPHNKSQNNCCMCNCVNNANGNCLLSLR